MITVLRWILIAGGFAIIVLWVFADNVDYVWLFIVIEALGWAVTRLASRRKGNAD